MQEFDSTIMAFHSLFKWTKQEFCLRDFIGKFRQRLPLLMVVCTGYEGKDGLHEYAADEIYWVFDVQTQDRIVARDDRDRFVSIPVDYPTKFHLLDSRKADHGPSLPMRSIISRDFHGKFIMLEDDARVPFQVGVDQASSAQFGVMEIVEKYSEKYLLTHALVNEEMHPSVTGMPAYVPITVDVATGFVHGTTDAFNDWIAEMKKIGNNFTDKHTMPCKEILIFDESPAGDYKYINPHDLFIPRYPTFDDEPSSPSPYSSSKEHRKSSSSSSSSASLDSEVGVSIGRSASLRSQSSNKSLTLPKSKTTQVRAAPISPQVSSHTLGKMDRGGNKFWEESNRSTKSSISEPGPPLPKPRVIGGPPTRELPLPPMKKSQSFTTESERMQNCSPKLPAPRNFNMLSGQEPQNQVSIEGKKFNPAPDTPVRRSSLDNQHQNSSGFQRPGAKLPSDGGSTNTKNVYGNSKEFQPTTKVFPTVSSPIAPVPSSKSANPSPFSKVTTPPAVKPKSGSPTSVVPCNSKASAASDWSNLQSIPEDIDIKSLSVDQVARCLELLGLHKFSCSFRSSIIDGILLMALTDDMLVKDFGFAKFEAKKLLMFAQDNWRPKL